MLDQEFAALIGATSAIRDEDITNKLPSQVDDSLTSLSLTLHVQLARLIARLLGSMSRNFPFISKWPLTE
jgi:hypothetical protein